MAQIQVDYMGAFQKMGLDFKPFIDKGVKVHMSTSGLKFGLADGEIVANAPIAPAKIAAIASGFNPSDQSHQTIKATVVGAIKKLEAHLSAPVEAPAKGAAQHVTSASQAASHATSTSSNWPPVFPLHKMKTEPLVKAKMATQLFQPVQGTSQSSRYYVVGMGPGIVVAARHQAGNLSVRVEGSKFAALSPKIIEAGVFGPEFDGQFKAEYASMHLAVASKVEAQRIVGAVLGALAPAISHAVPDLQPLMAA